MLGLKSGVVQLFNVSKVLLGSATPVKEFRQLSEKIEVITLNSSFMYVADVSQARIIDLNTMEIVTASKSLRASSACLLNSNVLILGKAMGSIQKF